jgi:hypothetical protein
MMIAMSTSKIAKGPNDNSENILHRTISAISASSGRKLEEQNRHTSWHNFVSKLLCHTPMNKVWNMVQKIKGKDSKTNIHHLKDGQDTLTSEQDISNKLGQTFKKYSSTEKYYPEFQKF